ncbi:hypothetical protein JavanS635_0008 [Streptococcus satellite phage Javan635]|nr:hypothetical protein JavanS635_0008 [Streptococcus satellite phage Javan635]
MLSKNFLSTFSQKYIFVFEVFVFISVIYSAPKNAKMSDTL